MADTVGSTPLTAAASCYVFACVLVPYVYAVTPMVNCAALQVRPWRLASQCTS